MLQGSRDGTIRIYANPPNIFPIVLWFDRDAAEFTAPLEPHVLPFLLVYFYHVLKFYVLGPPDG